MRVLFIVLCLSALSQAVHARDVIGEMTYPERIALPDGAELRLELRGAEGVVAEATIATDGRQVPLPFVIVAPRPGEEYRLRGAIFVGGRAEWLSDEVVVGPGDGALALGPVRLRRHAALGLSTLMRCGDVEVEVATVDPAVVLRLGGEAVVLQPVEAASGAKFSDGATPETVFWSKGNAAQVTLRGEALPECVPVIEPPLLPLTARGNEPFWRLDLTETEFSLQTPDGALRETRVPQASAVAEGVRFVLEPDLGLTVERRLCRDTMTGMPHPMTAKLAAGGEVLSGCAGQPARLLDGGWRVDHIKGVMLPEGAEVTLAFDAATGAVFGTSACNRYRGGFTLTGEGLTFGPAAGTMMACPDDLMAVERAFLATLESIERFDLAENGTLELISGDEALIRARR
jgi:heat shock protein HslJ/uncharacterized lipoprotein YbaY